MRSLDPRLFVIKVGKKCYVKEAECYEERYGIVANIAEATFYTEEIYCDGVEGILRKANMLGGELLEVTLFTPKEAFEDGREESADE